MLEALQPFGLSDFTTLISNIETHQWGQQLKVYCRYDPLGSNDCYQLIFHDCSHIHWHVYAPEQAEDSEADLIDFQLNETQIPKTAILYTDIFEISISYRHLSVAKLLPTDRSIVDPHQPLHITSALQSSGYTNTSIDHDRVLTTIDSDTTP